MRRLRQPRRDYACDSLYLKTVRCDGYVFGEHVAGVLREVLFRTSIELFNISSLKRGIGNVDEDTDFGLRDALLLTSLQEVGAPGI